MKVKPATREPVPSTKRRPMTWKRKVEILLEHVKCKKCKGRLWLGYAELDHVVPLAMGGRDEPFNIEPLCPPCHREKTKEDARIIAKDKRIHGLTKTKKKKIPGRKMSETYREQKEWAASLQEKDTNEPFGNSEQLEQDT